MTDSGMAHCRQCQTDKPLDAFYVSTHNGRPRKPCKSCLQVYRRTRYTQSKGDERSYDQLLRREYGITLEQYEEMVRRQANRCAICRRGESVKMRSGKMKRLAVDHDHVTGAVRGLLCHRCNILVWAIEDNHTTLDSIRRYVDEWRETFAHGGPV